MIAIKSSLNFNKLQLFIGVVSLFLGSVIYIIRSPHHTYFISKYFLDFRLTDDIPAVIKVFGGNLCDFIHPFALILITSGLISLANRSSHFFVCLGWFLLECFFELGQYFKETYLIFIPSWFDNVPFLQNTRSFFLNGTFDKIDILSFLLGSVCAFFILSINYKRRRKSES